MTPSVSVVVPAYNVDKYLPECIDSILNQTFANFEVIIVNDGSVDKTGEICDVYAQKDTRVKVFHTNNQGVSAARRLGVTMSIGSWLYFVDGDDTIPEKALEMLFSHAENADFDIVIGYINEKIPTDSCIVITNEEYRHKVLTYNETRYSVWGKLYRREVVKELYFNIPPSIKTGEDKLVNVQIAFSIKSDVLLLNESVYNYRTDNLSSVMHNFKNTLKNEEEYYTFLYSYIPDSDKGKYMNELIKCRINALTILYRQNNDREWLNSDYYKTLLADIQKYDYKLTLSNKLLFCKIPYLYRLAYKFKCAVTRKELYY